MRLVPPVLNTFQALAWRLLSLVHMKPSKSKVLFYAIAVGLAGAFSFWIGGQSVRMGPATTNAETERERAAKEPDSVPHLELARALHEGAVETVIKGNGREHLVLAVQNQGQQPLNLVVSAGQIFTSAETAVILLRSCEIELEKGKVARTTLETAAVRAGGPVVETSFHVSDGKMPMLNPLIDYLAEHPEVSTAAAQTAVLALTDNLPVSAFATFAPVGGEMPSILDTTPFRVDVVEIMSALLILRDLQVPPSTLALTVDPQLRIEAMIDPMAHALAMEYYDIAPSREWEYWKWELSHGNEATRHYALFGIARFFPGVALQMLPRWVREQRTNQIYRMAALQALAETNRPETLAILQQLAAELGSETELGRTAMEAAQYVELRRQREKAPKVAVAFRIGDPQF